MHRYKSKYPKQFAELVKMASNTRDYNNNAMRTTIFIVTQCPEMVDEILRAIIDFKKLYHMFYDKLPLASRVGYKIIEAALKQYVLGGKTLDQKLDELSEWVRKKCDITSTIVDVVFGDRDIAQQTLETVVRMSADVINKAINSVDPYGILLPMTTYMLYDIIVARVNKGLTHL